MNRPVLLIACCILLITFIVMAGDFSLKVILIMFVFSGFLALSLGIFHYLTDHKYDDVQEDR